MGKEPETLIHYRYRAGENCACGLQDVKASWSEDCEDVTCLPCVRVVRDDASELSRAAHDQCEELEAE